MSNNPIVSGEELDALSAKLGVLGLNAFEQRRRYALGFIAFERSRRRWSHRNRSYYEKDDDYEERERQRRNERNMNMRAELLQAIGLHPPQNHHNNIIKPSIIMSQEFDDDDDEEDEDDEKLVSSFEICENSIKSLEKEKNIEESIVVSSVRLEEINSSSSKEEVRISKSSFHVYHPKCILSLSLALFVKGWVGDQKMTASWAPLNKGGLAFTVMWDRVCVVYESSRGRGGHGRKVLQFNANDSVVVSDIVVVSEEGSGNLTTINDAIAAAPNNSAPSE
ncbi:putative pectinesterase/pectinesterase inhibitor 7 [Senna tora]|uniref:Putative pectinesterase/pectinesterase inhibitor 7 n=1 Tax=Senna tora TaxID=362788 RepID=A0A834XCQ7_9FABA|nr:putative pectinesterase/pectinesterase inhibitor 7 [Senna tora]